MALVFERVAKKNPSPRAVLKVSFPEVNLQSTDPLGTWTQAFASSELALFALKFL